MTKRRAKRDKRWKLIRFAFFFCVFLGVFTLIWLRTTVVDLEYELSDLERQKVALIREGRLFSAEKANVYSIEKIEETAVKRLGMKVPERDQIYFVQQTTGAAPYKVSARSLSRQD